MNTSAQIRKRINHHSMWISCKFETGEFFKLRVTRYNKSLEGTMNDEDDMSVIQDWIDGRNTTPYGNLFRELETLCKGCNTGEQLITKMRSNGNNS